MLDLTKTLTAEEHKQLREWSVSRKHCENHMSTSRAYDKIMHNRTKLGLPKLSPSSWRSELEMGGVKEGNIFGYRIPKEKPTTTPVVEEPTETTKYFPREKLDLVAATARMLMGFNKLGRKTGLYEILWQILPSENGGKRPDEFYNDLLMELHQMDIVEYRMSGKKGKWIFVMNEEEFNSLFPQCIPSPQDIEGCRKHMMWLNYKRDKKNARVRQIHQQKLDAEAEKAKAEKAAAEKAKAEKAAIEAALKAEAEKAEAEKLAAEKAEAEIRQKRQAEEDWLKQYQAFKNLVVQYTTDGVVNMSRLDRITMGRFTQYWVQIMLSDGFLQAEGIGLCKVYRLVK